MDTVRILLLADTHLGFDHPFRPRVQRRRRGPDFFANFERSLEPALRGEVDLVVHGGDVLYRSKVPPELVRLSFEPLQKIAANGTPVFVVPGNHERSEIPYRLLAEHPGIHIFDRPRTFLEPVGSLRIAVAGFPFVRYGIRGRFPGLVEETGWRNVNADIRLLCIHQSVEGATVGAANYVFRYGKDVIRASDIPGNFAAVLAGHIHRAQVLEAGLSGRPTEAPVLYPGAIERASFAERNERKGFMVLAFAGHSNGRGILKDWRFCELPCRPMCQLEIDALEMSPAELGRLLKRQLESLPPDAVVKLQFKNGIPEVLLPVIRVASLRKLTPPGQNLTISYSTSHPWRRQGGN
jgi:DNA repair exonuclease SbcCD nuclease subunit